MENTILFESAATFAVPCALVDRHLDAPETELKLLLLLIRHANAAFLKTELCEALQTDEDRLEKAFQYWIRRGVLYWTAGRYSLQRPKLTTSDFIKYTPDSISQRLREDEKLKFLYEKAEMILKKPLNVSDSSLLLSLVDWCGLPAEVVLMLLQYGTENNMSLKQIEKTGILWSEEGVKTYEDAEARIQTDIQKKQAANRVASRLGINGRALTGEERKLFEKWTGEYGFDTDMIFAAYEATVKGTGKYSYPYLDTVLSSWYNKGFRTPEEAAAEPLPQKKRRGKKKPVVQEEQSQAQEWDWQILEKELNS